MVEKRTGMASHETKIEKGVIQGELRRQLSVVDLRASLSCLLDRRGRPTEEQEGGVEGEEGGEGDAVGD